MIQKVYENWIPSIASTYETIKRKEEAISWKYAHEKKKFSINQMFFSELRNDRIIADFDFYYVTIRHFHKSLKNMESHIEKTIVEINKDLEE